jgi:DNA-binding protein H-NS
MGITDRLKDLKTKAEAAVVEHSDQLHDAVEKATTTADKRTGGKYSERIQKAGAKADTLVHSLEDTEKQAGADDGDGAPTPTR